ncbi:DMT family transporter [Aestuariibacter salexigens]|uniref:DMT family transporter n=1 Tax=Aestuariibacter salexigens TaxID=226010 RepID=UPI0003FD10DD|nr:DMT family transporter [Aestuariibacter salexigens]
MPSPVVLGALCLIVAEALFAGVGAMVKHLSESLTQTQLVFFRNLAAMLVMLPWILRGGRTLIHTDKFPLHLFRASTGLIAMYCFFYVLANMPLAPAMMALLIAPFIVPLIARVWLKETISIKTLVAMMIGFVGAALVLNPGSEGINIFIVLAVLCACLVATTKCTIRKLTDSEPSLRIVGYFTGISTIISFFPMLWDWQPISLHNTGLLAIMGVFAAVGQVLMTRAFRLASPVKIGLLTYTSVIFAAMLGYLLWQEPISTGLLAGSVLIVWAANITLRQRWLL